MIVIASFDISDIAGTYCFCLHDGCADIVHWREIVSFVLQDLVCISYISESTLRDEKATPRLDQCQDFFPDLQVDTLQRQNENNCEFK